MPEIDYLAELIGIEVQTKAQRTAIDVAIEVLREQDPRQLRQRKRAGEEFAQLGELRSELAAQRLENKRLTQELVAVQQKTCRADSRSLGPRLGLTNHKPAHDVIANLRKQHAEELQRVRQNSEWRVSALERLRNEHEKNEGWLRAELEELRELVHPKGTWFAGKDPRRKKLKSLYCAWLGRWRYYREHIVDFARDDQTRGLRWWPDRRLEERVESATRALFDAAVGLADELDPSSREACPPARATRGKP